MSLSRDVECLEEENDELRNLLCDLEEILEDIDRSDTDKISDALDEIKYTLRRLN